MYADAVAQITESIFPIYYVDVESGSVGVCGTGFLVDDSGLFLTSEHVMASPPPGSTAYYYGKTPDQVCEPVEFEHVASDPARDLYLGRVAGDSLRPVEVSDEPVRPGDSLCLSGYPLAVLDIRPDRGGVVGNVRRYWQPSFVIDATQTVIDGRTYDGYIVSDACFPGMSGGPVFDMEGRVRGMAAATLTRTIPPLPGETPTVVPNAIVIDVEHIRAFLETVPAVPATPENGRLAPQVGETQGI
jgi:S1-C subfamily serine protease